MGEEKARLGKGERENGGYKFYNRRKINGKGKEKNSGEIGGRIRVRKSLIGGKGDRGKKEEREER